MARGNHIPRGPGGEFSQACTIPPLQQSPDGAQQPQHAWLLPCPPPHRSLGSLLGFYK